MKNLRQEHGEPDVIKVRQTFKTEKETRGWENKVLRRMRVIDNIRWLNKKLPDRWTRTGPLSEEHKRKIGDANRISRIDREFKKSLPKPKRSYTISDEERKRRSETAKRTFIGIKQSEDHIKKRKICGDSNPAKRIEVRQKISNKAKRESNINRLKEYSAMQKGIPRTEEVKNKIRKTKKERGNG